MTVTSNTRVPLIARSWDTGSEEVETKRGNGRERDRERGRGRERERERECVESVAFVRKMMFTAFIAIIKKVEHML